METTPTRFSYEDSVYAYYAELMESKEPAAIPTVEELLDVSRQAAELTLEDADPVAVNKLMDSYGHPFGRMWTTGILDGFVYYQWAYAVELPRARAQVDAELAKRRKAASQL